MQERTIETLTRDQLYLCTGSEKTGNVVTVDVRQPGHQFRPVVPNGTCDFISIYGLTHLYDRYVRPYVGEGLRNVLEPSIQAYTRDLAGRLIREWIQATYTL